MSVHPPAPEPMEAWRFESMIGSRVFLGIGCISLLFAAVFFYQIEASHVSALPPAVRVYGGICAALALMFFGGRSITSPASYVGKALTALGAAIGFLALWAGFGPFGLISMPTAFLSMMLISGALAVIAFRKNSQIVAAGGLLGGALTPGLLVAAHIGRPELAAYYVVLSGTMLALAVKGRFRIVEWIAYGVAVCLTPVFANAPYVGWSRTDALVVATLFFLEFAVTQYVTVWQDRETGWMRITMIARDVVTYTVILWAEFIDDRHGLGLALTLLAMPLFAAAWMPGPAARVRTAYAALGIGALTLAIPAFFSRDLTGCAFAIEMAGFVFVGLRFPDLRLRCTGYALGAIAAVAALVSAAADAASAPFFNERFLEFAVLASALAVCGRLMRTNAPLLSDAEVVLGTVFRVAAYVVGAASVAVEIVHDPFISETLRQSALSAEGIVLASALVARGFIRRVALQRYAGLAVFVVTIVKVYNVDLAFVSLGARTASLAVLGATLVAVAAIYQASMRRHTPIRGRDVPV